MHSYSIKNKNMHFHIIHSMEIMHSMYMFMRSQCTHASLPRCPYKKSRISKMKNIAFIHLPHFFQDLFRDPVMVSTHLFLIPFEILSAL